MNMLVATRQTQGQRDNDFCFVSEGEMVSLGFICAQDRDPETNEPLPDSGCGCARSFVGMTSKKGTTTAQVVEMDMDRDALLALYLDAAPFLGQEEDLDALLDTARRFPVGTIVEKRGKWVQTRTMQMAEG